MNIILTPALRRFVDEQVECGRYLDAGEVVRTALRHWEMQAAYPDPGARGDGDIMALAFVVMMEAAKSAREDLKAIMDGVKAINKAKEGLRDVAAKVSRDAAANAGCHRERRALAFSRGMGTEGGYHRVRLPVPDPDAPGGVRYERTNLHPGRIARVEDLQAILNDVKGRLDGLGELGEMESLRMQMAMDRLSKLMSALSNLLKKAGETDAGLIQNIK